MLVFALASPDGWSFSSFARNCAFVSFEGNQNHINLNPDIKRVEQHRYFSVPLSLALNIQCNREAYRQINRNLAKTIFITICKEKQEPADLCFMNDIFIQLIMIECLIFSWITRRKAGEKGKEREQYITIEYFVFCIDCTMLNSMTRKFGFTWIGPMIQQTSSPYKQSNMRRPIQYA